ncbi:MAG: hypothetical protein QOI93_2645 [Rhodospirillaceae bacterium]|jgi:hypothetical protein|nr:hypothetical protein [Rhodospirillaceae bacterium]
MLLELARAIERAGMDYLLIEDSINRVRSKGLWRQ